MTVKVADAVVLLSLAEMLTVVLDATEVVVIVNVALVAPAATVTLAGTVATEVLLLVSVTAAPPAGAAPFKVTVPVDEVPPLTLDGLSVTLEGIGALTVKFADLVVPLNSPEMLTVALAATGVVVIVNVALVAPAATVTLAGTVAADVLLLVSVTAAPPAGAAPFKVTVPVDEVPSVTLVGLSVTLEGIGALTVKFADLVVPLNSAEMLDVALAATGVVVTVNVALVAPAATVTLAGTVAADVLLLVSVTAAPPAGAAPFKVTVPVDEVPPVTLVGLSVTLEGVGALTVRFTDFVVPLSSAEMLTVALAVTGVVVIVNVALVAPAATVTLAGTVAADVLLLPSVTAAPPAGAAPFKVTVPVEEVPPVTLVGLSVTPEGIGALTVRFADFVVPLNSPEMVTVALTATGVVVIVNVALVAPAATVTLAGTVAAAVLLLPSVTTAPPVGAALLNVTVPVEEAPPVTVAGLTDTEETVGGFTVSVAPCVPL